tara:strand:+ start:59 stop:553 length:495 start_codon:yes stop_codon:yes gene_type:complete
MAIYYADGSNSEVGRIIQVVTYARSSVFSTSSESWTDIGLSASITPKQSTSDILIYLTIYASSNDNHSQRLLRGSSVIEAGGSSGSRSQGFGGGFNCGNDADVGCWSGTFFDSPNTTSATTYKVQTITGGGGSGYVYYGRDKSNGNNHQHTRSRQRITLMEVAS